MATPATPETSLRRTPLYDLHVAAGAKMVPFAGYEMPVQYPLGVLKEHLWTREKAGLFDVSHMGQMAIAASDGRHETAARALESLVPADILNLKPGQQRYTQLLADDGGILDDLMVTRPASDGEAGHIYVVVNASCKDADHAHMMARLPSTVRLVRGDDRALIALQGPAAADVVGASGTARLAFMQAAWFDIAGVRAHVSRSGYTGEDGVEISVSADAAVRLWSALAADPRVQPIGLGARDSLRLEAGLCLYGHDIDTTTSPIEAALGWSIQKRRRTEGGFPGAARVQREIAAGPSRLRVGIRPEGRAPAREGTEIQDAAGQRIGVITSGGFGPSANAPVAMGYVTAPHANVGTKVQLLVRGKPLPADVVALPFQPHRYAR